VDPGGVRRSPEERERIRREAEEASYELGKGLPESIPLDAVYRIRHLLVPEALALVERVKVITDVAPLGVKAGAEASATTGEGR